MSLGMRQIACVASVLVLLVVAIVGCGTQSGMDETVPETGYFESVRPACTALPGSDRDPCERVLTSTLAAGLNAGGYGLTLPPLPLDPEWVYRALWFGGGNRTPQVVIRGVVAMNSARCSEVRAYNIGEDNHKSWGEDSPVTREVCYVDVAVNEYIVGSGPSRIPIVIHRRRSVPRTDVGYGTDSYFADLAAPIRDSLEGSEFIFELATPWDFAWADWRPVHSWDVQRNADWTIVGVSGMWPLFSGKSNIEDWEYPLDELQEKLKAAHAKVAAEYGGRISDEPGSPMLVTDASRESLLAQLRELGAYDAPGITPAPAPPAPDSGWSLWR